MEISDSTDPESLVGGTPTHDAWRLGFAAGMQRMDIYSDPIRHPERHEESGEET